MLKQKQYHGVHQHPLTSLAQIECFSRLFEQDIFDVQHFQETKHPCKSNESVQPRQFSNFDHLHAVNRIILEEHVEWDNSN
jgi:hypothetical protein